MLDGIEIEYVTPTGPQLYRSPITSQISSPRARRSQGQRLDRSPVSGPLVHWFKEPEDRNARDGRRSQRDDEHERPSLAPTR